MSLAERQRRLDRARFAIHVELSIGIDAVMLTAFLFFVRGGFEPMFFVPRWFQLLFLAAPVVSLLAWVWMLRLSRPQPETGERSWRYHYRAA
jgi:hypothetical protein